MPITLKVLLGISVLRIAVFVIFDLLLMVFVTYHPDSGFLATLRYRLAERQIGDQDYSLGQAINAIALISIGIAFLAPVVAAIKTRNKKWVIAAKISLGLLLLSNLIRIRLYSVILDIISLILFFARGSKEYFSESDSLKGSNSTKITE